MIKTFSKMNTVHLSKLADQKKNNNGFSKNIDSDVVLIKPHLSTDNRVIWLYTW